jgi:hypothetical protein
MGYCLCEIQSEQKVRNKLVTEKILFASTNDLVEHSAVKYVASLYCFEIEL